jgi:antagonist of KipI
VLGSRATSVISRMGPFGGRPVAAGDLLPIGHAPARTDAPVPRALSLPRGGARLRAIAGPQDALFGTAMLDRFFASTYTITPASNRMGYRLEGEPLLYGSGGDMLSEATPLGSVQVPKSGQPILLMADRQTTGGYPKIATVISADTPVAGQLAPGDWVRFAPCTRAEAVDALARLEQRFAARTPQ